MEDEKRVEEHHETHEHHENHDHHKHTFTEKIRENPWILSTVICGILALVLLVSIFFGGGITGNAISAKSAGDKIVTFFQGQGYDVAVDSVKEVSGLYEVTLTYNDQLIPIYVTKDGKSFTETLTPTGQATSDSASPTQKEVPKTDKPSVELYVFTYCPYGTQMEKAMIPVAKLLGNKVDFKIRQIGAMHGEHEKLEAERQLCIEKNYPTKFLDYVLAFAEDSAIGACNGDATCLTPKLTALYTKLGITSSKIDSCITSEGLKLYEAEVANSGSKGVSGSPTLIINGVTSSAARNPEAIKGAICNAFTTVPSECSTTLSTSSPSAGFGSETTASTTAASC